MSARFKPSRRAIVKLVPAALCIWVRSAPGAAATSPAEKLDIAVIGPRGRGRDNLRACRAENIVAVCDVDEKNLAEAIQTDAPRARAFTDWRRMFDEMHKSIDAVIVSTPDHTHAGPTLAALRLGKHVYCEKPLTWSVGEARLVRQAAARAGKATQMGTQIHAGDNYRRVVELIRAGAIGTVSEVHTFMAGGISGGQRPADTPPCPPHLHWDLWLGPAPFRPYHPAYVPFRWRGWWDFGSGMLGDFGCHHMDVAFWALGLDYPASVEAEGPPVHPESTPPWLVVRYEFPAAGERPPVRLTWYHGNRKPPQFAEGLVPQGDKWNAGSLFVGDRGMLLTDYGRHILLPQEKYRDYQRPPQSIPASIGHHAEWIRACREGTPTTCNFEYAGILTEAVLLGNVAYRAGARLQWDAPNLAIPNAPAAEQFLHRRPHRGM